MPRTYKRLTDRPYEQKKAQNIPAKFRTGFLAGLDKRTDLAKTLRANYQDIADDLGGLDELGHIKRALIQRYVWLQAIVQTFEQDMATNQELTKAEFTDLLQRWTSSTAAMVSLAKTLGVDRKQTRRDYANLIEIEPEGTDAEV